MIYTAIDTFYLTDEELENSPSRKDGIDEATETTLRIYGCDLIQESGILLKLQQQVMATGQVLFHRFYCKKSFARFNVKRVAASCIWLASMLGENHRDKKNIINVFYRIECRRENLHLPIEHLYASSKKYMELEMDLVRYKLHILKEMGFVCHVEHPHKFILTYLAVLEAPPEVRQEAWNLANDSLRTTLCVRFKSPVVACGVVYAAARRFHVPLPENPPWWKAFDARKKDIDEVCKALAHLYTLPEPQFIPVCKEKSSLTMCNNRSWDSPCQPLPKMHQVSLPAVISDSDDSIIKSAIGKLNDSVKSDDDMKEHRIKEKERERERHKGCDRKRGRDYEREKVKDKMHQSKDRGKDSGHGKKRSRG